MIMRIVGRISSAVVALALVSLIQTPAAFAANGALKVTSFPSGAAVTIDGIFTGKYKLMNEPLLAADFLNQGQTSVTTCFSVQDAEGNRIVCVCDAGLYFTFTEFNP